MARKKRTTFSILPGTQLGLAEDESGEITLAWCPVKSSSHDGLGSPRTVMRPRDARRIFESLLSGKSPLGVKDDLDGTHFNNYRYTVEVHVDSAWTARWRTRWLNHTTGLFVSSPDGLVKIGCCACDMKQLRKWLKANVGWA